MEHIGAHIEFRNASVTFDDGAELLEALRGLDLAIEPGESVALIGPSGCGKSTTLRMLAGVLAPTTGAVLVNGAPLSRPRRETALIQQDLGLFPWKTVLQNAALGLVVRKVPRAEAEARAREALAEVGLAGFERSYPKELSGGMRQRLALARALAMDADLLLMDEPLSAVDALLRESLQDTLLELWRTRRHTQLLVTHSIEEAVYLGGRILVFSDRPARLKADIANPGMGAADWRDSAEFAAKCHEVRAALAAGVEAASAAEVTAEAASNPAPAADAASNPVPTAAPEAASNPAPEAAPDTEEATR